MGKGGEGRRRERRGVLAFINITYYSKTHFSTCRLRSDRRHQIPQSNGIPLHQRTPLLHPDEFQRRASKIFISHWKKKKLLRALKNSSNFVCKIRLLEVLSVKEQQNMLSAVSFLYFSKRKCLIAQAVVGTRERT